MTDDNTLGAFVEIAHERLDRKGLVLLGMCKALAMSAARFDDQARVVSHPVVGVEQTIAQTLRECAEYMRGKERDLQLELTRAGLKSNAAALHNIPKEPL